MLDFTCEVCFFGYVSHEHTTAAAAFHTSVIYTSVNTHAVVIPPAAAAAATATATAAAVAAVAAAAVATPLLQPGSFSAEVLASFNLDEGMDVNEVVNELNLAGRYTRMSAATVRNTVEFLVADGFLYPSPDNHHFKVTPLSPFQITAATAAAAAAAADAALPPASLCCSDQVFEIFDKFIGSVNDSYEDKTIDEVVTLLAARFTAAQVRQAVDGRGLHSSPFQLNLSRFGHTYRFPQSNRLEGNHVPNVSHIVCLR